MSGVGMGAERDAGGAGLRDANNIIGARKLHDNPKYVPGLTLFLPVTLSSVAARFFPRDEYFMRLALREAERALEHDDVPVGALVVHGGEVVGSGHNERELRQDPSAHAEMLALREA